jgi:hypothetical protein
MALCPSLVIDHMICIVAVLRESNRAFLLNAQLFTMLHLEEQEEHKEALKQSPPSAGNNTYPLSQILAVVGAGKSTRLFIDSSAVLIV